MPLQAEALVAATRATVEDADLVESSVDVAVIVIVSGAVPSGVNVTPVPELTPVSKPSDPSAVGLTVRFTVFVNAPVPVTVGVHVEVCPALTLDGEHTTDTPVMVGEAAVTVMFAEPDMLVNPATAE